MLAIVLNGGLFDVKEKKTHDEYGGDGVGKRKTPELRVGLMKSFLGNCWRAHVNKWLKNFRFFQNGKGNKLLVPLSDKTR